MFVFDNLFFVLIVCLFVFELIVAVCIFIILACLYFLCCVCVLLFVFWVSSLLLGVVCHGSQAQEA